MRSSFLAIFLLAVFSAVPAFAGGGTVIQISRSLKMSNADAPAPKDYYLDIGEIDGVKGGDVFTVYRIFAVVDGRTGDASNALKIPLGDVKVFVTGEFTSIARLVAPINPRDLPMLDYPVVMLGDEVKLKSSLPFQQ